MVSEMRHRLHRHFPYPVVAWQWHTRLMGLDLHVPQGGDYSIKICQWPQSARCAPAHCSRNSSTIV
jgi:hypothetical protein